MKGLSKLIFSSIIMVLCSCGGNNLMKYYYPINDKNETKVYKYVDPSNSKTPVYWKVTTDFKNKTILTESYDSRFNRFNSFFEKIKKKEADLLRYVDYETGTNETITEINATIKKNKVYRSNKKEPYFYAVEYNNMYGKTHLEKKREFVDFEEITVQGKKYSTAKFKEKYLINEKDDTFIFYQISYYAKGMGMVKSERNFPNSDGEVLILELEKIMTAAEFKKLKM